MIKEWLSRFFPLDCKCTSMHGIGLKESKRVAVGGSDKERCELTENGIRPQPEGTWLTLCALYVIPTPFNIIWQWPIHPTTNLNIYQNFTHWTSITQTSWTKNLFSVHIPIIPRPTSSISIYTYHLHKRVCSLCDLYQRILS